MQRLHIVSEQVTSALKIAFTYVASNLIVIAANLKQVGALMS